MLPSQLPEPNTVVAFDCETSGLHPDSGARVSTVSVAWHADHQIRAYAWPFDQGTSTKGNGQQSFLDQTVNLPETEWQALLRWLGQRRLVAHNAKFDITMMATGTRAWSGIELVDQVVWCTMVAHPEFEPLQPVALKATSQRLGLQGGIEGDKESILKQHLRTVRKQNGLRAGQGGYDLAAWDVLEPYATQDAILCLLLYEWQQEALAGGLGRLDRIEREIEVMKVLYRMERRGVAFDVGAAFHAAGRLRRERKTAAAILPFRPTDKSANDYWFGIKGLIPYETTPTGRPKMTERVRAQMVTEGVEYAAEYDRYCKLDTALSMWYDAYPQATGSDGRLRTVYRQLGTVSSRFSAERINLQAIPHDYRQPDWFPNEIPTVRSLFRAKPGYELWELDISQADLRVATRYARCERMRALLESGADVHGQTATDLFGAHPDDGDWDFHRHIAKRGNLSFINGVGPPRFRADLYTQTGIRLSEAESERIVGGWRRLYPEYGRAIWKAQKLAERRGWVHLAQGRFGDKRWFQPYEDTHRSFNQAVQGTVAVILKYWLLEIERRWPGVLVLTVHDSAATELPEGEAEMLVKEIAAVGAEIATDIAGIEMPIEAKRWWPA